MAISLSTDLVMDVLKAADPQSVADAKAKLAAARSETPQTATRFEGGASLPAPRADAAPAGAHPMQRFEAMVLGQFFQAMLPQESSEVYGGGVAGDMWKSMLAQQLGEVVAERGGIASRYLADHYKEGKQVVALSGVADPATRDALDAQRSLSTSVINEMQRQIARTLAADTTGGTTGKR